MNIRHYRKKDVREPSGPSGPEPGIDVPFAHPRTTGAIGNGTTFAPAGDASALMGFGEPQEDRLTSSLLRQPVLHSVGGQTHVTPPPSTLPPHTLRAHFRRIGMEESLIDQMVTFPGRTSSAMQEQHFDKVIRRLVPTGATIPEDGRVIASFIGPTGVGKTTAITKLATRFSRHGRAVSLITTDTHRVGAVEQLDACARAIGAPLRIVYVRSDFIAALDASHDADVVLIDTPGVSPYDDVRLEDLRSLVGYREAVHCYLTLAASSDQTESIEAARRFGRINPAALILTKLDETRRYGTMFNVAASCGLPVGYFATGPDVDTDLLAATPEIIRDYVLPHEGSEEAGEAA